MTRQLRSAPSAEELFRALADPERLAIAGSLATEPGTLPQLAERLHLHTSRVQRHLAKLTSVGLARVASDRRTYFLEPSVLRSAAREASPPREPGLALGAIFEDEEAVLRRYFRDGRLVEIPAKQSKRRMVLSRLALEFDIGVRYPERQVNSKLERFHHDYAALRRYLVDEAFLSRAGGEYWRSGGKVEI